MEEKDIIHSLRDCKSRVDFIGLAILFLIPAIAAEIIGILKMDMSVRIFCNIITWGVYLLLIWVLITECRSGIVSREGVKITFYNFKEWTDVFPWEEYEEIKIENTQLGQYGRNVFVMTLCKKKINIHDFIFSGNIIVMCTEENYALIKSWIPDSVRIPKVKF